MTEARGEVGRSIATNAVLRNAAAEVESLRSSLAAAEERAERAEQEREELWSLNQQAGLAHFRGDLEAAERRIKELEGAIEKHRDRPRRYPSTADTRLYAALTPNPDPEQ